MSAFAFMNSAPEEEGAKKKEEQPGVSEAEATTKVKEKKEVKERKKKKTSGFKPGQGLLSTDVPTSGAVSKGAKTDDAAPTVTPAQVSTTSVQYCCSGQGMVLDSALSGTSLNLDHHSVSITLAPSLSHTGHLGSDEAA